MTTRPQQSGIVAPAESPQGLSGSWAGARRRSCRSPGQLDRTLVVCRDESWLIRENNCFEGQRLCDDLFVIYCHRKENPVIHRQSNLGMEAVATKNPLSRKYFLLSKEI